MVTLGQRLRGCAACGARWGSDWGAALHMVHAGAAAEGRLAHARAPRKAGPLLLWDRVWWGAQSQRAATLCPGHMRARSCSRSLVGCALWDEGEARLTRVMPSSKSGHRVRHEEQYWLRKEGRLKHGKCPLQKKWRAVWVAWRLFWCPLQVLDARRSCLCWDEACHEDVLIWREQAVHESGRSRRTCTHNIACTIISCRMLLLQSVKLIVRVALNNGYIQVSWVVYPSALENIQHHWFWWTAALVRQT